MAVIALKIALFLSHCVYTLFVLRIINCTVKVTIPLLFPLVLVPSISVFKLSSPAIFLILLLLLILQLLILLHCSKHRRISRLAEVKRKNGHVLVGETLLPLTSSGNLRLDRNSVAETRALHHHHHIVGGGNIKERKNRSPNLDVKGIIRDCGYGNN